jgi:hypothetical protein
MSTGRSRGLDPPGPGSRERGIVKGFLVRPDGSPVGARPVLRALLVFSLLLSVDPDAVEAGAPSAAAVVVGLDGKLAEDEVAPVLARSAEIKLSARREGPYLRVNVVSEPIFVASLCIATENRVLVLHASAALGAVTYTFDGEVWSTTEKFDWAVRDTTQSKEARAERAQHLASHGWVATTARTGEPGVTEFLIHDDLVPQGARLALGLMPGAHPEAILGLPREPAGCANAELVGGPAPPVLRFVPENWREAPSR